MIGRLGFFLFRGTIGCAAIMIFVIFPFYDTLVID